MPVSEFINDVHSALLMIPTSYPRGELCSSVQTNCLFVSAYDHFSLGRGELGNDQTIHFWYVLGITKAFGRLMVHTSGFQPY